MSRNIEVVTMSRFVQGCCHTRSLRRPSGSPHQESPPLTASSGPPMKVRWKYRDILPEEGGLVPWMEGSAGHKRGLP